VSSDAAWVASIGTGTTPIHHADDLRVAVLALHEHPDLVRATAFVSWFLRRAASAQGVRHKYNHTIAVAWMRILDHVGGSRQTVEQLPAAHPWLADKRALNRHFRSRTLARPEAKNTFLPADLAPLP
jgi:hypothetical protein